MGDTLPATPTRSPSDGLPGMSWSTSTARTTTVPDRCGLSAGLEFDDVDVDRDGLLPSPLPDGHVGPSARRGADADWLPSRVWSDAGQVIASAIAICPSKPRDVAINR